MSWFLMAERARRQVISAATSALERVPEPKHWEPEMSTRKMTVSSRSSQKRLTKGWPMRAVTFQSMERMSSPGDVLADLVELDALALEDGVVLAGKVLVDQAVGDHPDLADLLHQFFGVDRPCGSPRCGRVGRELSCVSLRSRHVSDRR